MKISGVIDPSFEFSTLWELSLEEYISKFFSQVIMPGENCSATVVGKLEKTYHIGVVSCFTLFPLLTLPLGLLVIPKKWPGAVEATALFIGLFVFSLVYTLTVLAAIVLTLPAAVPIAIAHGGYRFFKQGGLWDQYMGVLKKTIN